MPSSGNHRYSPRRPPLLSFDRMAERETAVVLKELLSKGIAELKEAGAEATGIVADHAANLHAALGQLEAELGIPRLRCQAHLANLLLKDLAQEFQVILTRFCLFASYFAWLPVRI